MIITGDNCWNVFPNPGQPCPKIYSFQIKKKIFIEIEGGLTHNDVKFINEKYWGPWAQPARQTGSTDIKIPFRKKRI